MFFFAWGGGCVLWVYMDLGFFSQVLSKMVENLCIGHKRDEHANSPLALAMCCPPAGVVVEPLIQRFCETATGAPGERVGPRLNVTFLRWQNPKPRAASAKSWQRREDFQRRLRSCERCGHGAFG